MHDASFCCTFTERFTHTIEQLKTHDSLWSFLQLITDSHAVIISILFTFFVITHLVGL